jgi:hypothetical protein
MSATIVPLIPRFDPAGPGAERHYDGVVARLNRLAVRRRRTEREFALLERQFVEDDLKVAAGPRRGSPLTARGRRQRLEQLLECAATRRQQDEEWERLHAALDSMNRHLDHWARENFGLGASE